MRPGKYSRWSIVIAAVLGVVLMATGIWLLHASRDEYAPPKAMEYEGSR